jgi:predicted O-methyltransferase YrrM
MPEEPSTGRGVKTETRPIAEILQEKAKSPATSALAMQPVKQVNLFKKILQFVLDFTLLPFTFLGGIILKMMRNKYFAGYPLNKKLLLKIGVFPITDHYYEPLFNPKYIRHSLDTDRYLPSIDMNIQEQLGLLEKFNYSGELLEIPVDKPSTLDYYYNNYSFLSGDGEFLYNMIRFFKPGRIIEIGSGFSTLMASQAIRKNVNENGNYSCQFTCIEPFEHPWLEELNVKVLRNLVEKVDLSFFESLNENDILFIDSSHIIKPQGDVLYLFMHVLPVLKPGVIIHIHDIFTPKDYLEEWIVKKNRLWNEQYLLEAFLSFNEKFKIIGALNFLRHFHYHELTEKCPILKMQIDSGISREPGSFWIKKL